MERVDIAELEKSISLILKHIREDLGATHVNIQPENAMYWSISLDDAINLDKKPNVDEIGVGSVPDDMEFLFKMVASAESTSDAPALMLEHAAGVLRYLAAVVRA